ncbi:hypothetical protein H1P_190035 [Hyella patelloides LEGE 07179]|uniref:Glycosyltransferase 2-like domain-containing protein n=1 Tax=Hyella patelloides LEGE 07179 TaxID=945734 RepID=A0A563VP58_9CYAN|nr:glycosyltransferase [Hyella patelloides]VEP13236.1 hypothetical protein H1P_190035 [Hyella patelloides LEGE 07179]
MDDSTQYLSFLNSLGFPVQQQKIIEIKSHSISNLTGWQDLKTLVCLAETGEIYDIDFRYAWGSEIWQQNLVDHGWCESTLLAKKPENESKRHKLIIYLCEPTTKLNQKQKIATVPQRFVIGSYWETVNHLYQLLPIDCPFELQDIQKAKDSTSKKRSNFLTKQKPVATTKTKDILPTTFSLPPDSRRIGEGGLRTQGLYRNSLNQLPLVSVITIVFNGEKYLEQTIQSIVNSSYPNLEYIVIDGGSTDNSLAIIKKYEDDLDYWVSEPDRGIYDAMNKGTIAASGDYTLHINADDLLFDSQCLATVINEIQKTNQEQLSNLFSSVLFYRIDKETLSKRAATTPQSDPMLNIVKVPGSHQGFLGIRNSKSIFKSDLYLIVAERIVMSEKIKQERSAISTTTLAIFRSGGVSYGINFAMLNEMQRATATSRNPQVFFALLTEYLRLSLLWFGKITGLIKLKQKISQ